MTAENDDRTRQDWIASPDRIAVPQPRTVVSGRRRVGAPNDPQTIAESDFPTVLLHRRLAHGTLPASVGTALQLAASGGSLAARSADREAVSSQSRWNVRLFAGSATTTVPGARTAPLACRRRAGARRGTASPGGPPWMRWPRAGHSTARKTVLLVS